MLLPDMQQPRPTPDEIRRMWEMPLFTEIVDPPWAPTELLGHLGHIHSGGEQFFAAYAIAPSWHLNWFLSRNRLEDIRFVENFLSRVMPSAPGVPADLAAFDEVKWTWSSSYTLDGEFAHMLVGGGVYGEFTGDGVQAKAIGDRACAALFDHRYEDVQVYCASGAWSPFFSSYGVNWTWVGVDKAQRRAWVICTYDAS